MKSLISIFVAFLPQRYRRAFPSYEVGSTEAWFSGFIEFLVVLAWFMRRYFAWMASGMSVVPQQTFFTGMERAGYQAVHAFSFLSLIAFFVSPITLLLFYLTLEGLFRLGTAWITGEAACSLPLYLVGVLHGKAEQILREKKLGPRVADEVMRAESENQQEYDLLVASSRPKETWKEDAMVISYQDLWYDVVAHRAGDPPRRFVYLLKKRLGPPRGMLRKWERYDPNDVLRRHS